MTQPAANCCSDDTGETWTEVEKKALLLHMGEPPNPQLENV